MWGGCVCHNPQGLPVNLWTPGTVGQQRVECEICVSHVICIIVSVTVTLSRNVLVF